jgi:hypothetical protein
VERLGEMIERPRLQPVLSPPLAVDAGRILTSGDGALFETGPGAETAVEFFDYSDQYAPELPGVAVSAQLEPFAALAENTLLLFDPVIVTGLKQTGGSGPGPSGMYIADAAGGTLTPLTVPSSADDQFLGPLFAALSPDRSQLVLGWSDGERLNPDTNMPTAVLSILELEGAEFPVEFRSLTEVMRSPSMLWSAGRPRVEWSVDDTIALTGSTDDDERVSFVIRLER